MPDRDSPFAPSRFLLREDSERWPDSRNGLGKSVHFASTNSLSSEVHDIEDDVNVYSSPARSRASDRSCAFPIFLVVLAVALLAIAAGSELPKHRDGLSVYLRTLISSICPASAGIDSEARIPHAMKAAIEQLVLDTMQAREGKPDPPIRRDRDFARKANGGHIASQVTSNHRGLLVGRDNDPAFAIDDVANARRCWMIPSLPSQLGIRLSQLIIPSYVSVEHPSEDTAAERAPQNMTLWGVIDGKANTELYGRLTAVPRTAYDRHAPSIAKDLLWAPLSSFVYDIHNPHPVQAFPISPHYADVGITFGVFALEVHSNWGHSTTCLYKIGVHGQLA